MKNKMPPVLFHGTDAEFTKPKAGGYDSVFWTADSSAVAQTYIPEGGIKVHAGISKYDSNNPVELKIGSPFYEFAKRLGDTSEIIESDYSGRATRWKPSAKKVTNGDVVEYIKDVLGYQASEEGRISFELKSSGWDDELKSHIWMPANWSKPGFLTLVTGHENLKMYVHSQGEGDLGDAQYNHLSLFKSLAEKGYDGIIIDDFCQTKNWGNVEHIAYGFFPSSLDKLEIQQMPATHFEWGNDCTVKHTPEYLAYQAKKELSALDPHNKKSLSL